MAQTKPVAVWKSSEGHQKQAAALLGSLPRLPLEHQERIVVSWRGGGAEGWKNTLQLRVNASWARARIEIPGEWEGEKIASLEKGLSVVRPTWETFLNTCPADPLWELYPDKLVWRSGTSSATVPLEPTSAIPAIGTSKPKTVFSPELVKSFRGLLPVAPRDYIQLELHGVLVGKGFLASTDGLVLAFIPKVSCDHDVLIPSEILAWSESLPGCKLGVCENSFVVFCEGVVVEQSAFAQGKAFPIDRVMELRGKMSAAKLGGAVFSNQDFLTTLKRVGEWRLAGGTKLRLVGEGTSYRVEVPLSSGSLMKDELTTAKSYPPLDYQFDGKNLLLWQGIAAGLEGPVSVASGDKLPYRLKCGSTELYLVKPG